MKKNSITKIIVSTILFVAFLTTSLTLIIIAPKNEKVNLTYEVINENRADEYNYYVSYKITNNSYAAVKIGAIDFIGYENFGSSSEKLKDSYDSLYNVTLKTGESITHQVDFSITYYETLSHFEAQFEDAYFKNIDPKISIGIGLLLPMIVSGYLFIVSIVNGIKEKKQLKNEN